MKNWHHIFEVAPICMFVLCSSISPNGSRRARWPDWSMLGRCQRRLRDKRLEDATGRGFIVTQQVSQLETCESKNGRALLNQVETKIRDQMSWSAHRWDDGKRESTRHSLGFSYHSSFQRWSVMKNKIWSKWPKEKEGQEIRMFWCWSFHKMIKVKIMLMSHVPELCMWDRPICDWESRRRVSWRNSRKIFLPDEGCGQNFPLHFSFCV